MFGRLRRRVCYPFRWLFRFLKDDIWDVRYNDLGRFSSVVIYITRVVSLIVNNIGKNNLMLRSSALAYMSLVSIVPLLAVMFFLFKAFGGLQTLEAQVKAFVFRNLATGLGSQAVAQIETFMENIHAGAVGAVGFLFLIVIVINLIASVEKTLNEIWNVKKARPFWSRFANYWTLITIGPAFLAVSLGVTAYLESSIGVVQTMTMSPVGKFFLSMVPLVVTWLLFVATYQFLPNTKVKLSSALAGGIVAGTLWEIAKLAYTWYAVHMVTYSQIYGSLGAIPIFLLWLFLTWLIALVGAEVSYAHQHMKTYRIQKQLKTLSFQQREMLSIVFVVDVYNSFESRDVPPTISALEQKWQVPYRVVSELLHELVVFGFVRETQIKEGVAFLPSKPADEVKMSEIVSSIRDKGDTVLDLQGVEKPKALKVFFQDVEKTLRESYASVSVKDILEQEKV